MSIPNAKPVTQVEPTVADTSHRDAVNDLAARGKAIVAAQHDNGSKALQDGPAPRGYRGKHR